MKSLLSLKVFARTVGPSWCDHLGVVVDRVCFAGEVIRGTRRESFFAVGEKATSAPAGASDSAGTKHAAGHVLCPASSPVRAGHGFDSRELCQQTETPPDEAGWRFCLLVEPAGIEPASASPPQAALHT